MQAKICEAIEHNQIVEFSYDGLFREVEPHLVGIRNGKPTLSSFQIGGRSKSGNIPGWRPFTIPKIRALEVTSRTFGGPRQGYNPNDSRMSSIICRL